LRGKSQRKESENLKWCKKSFVELLSPEVRELLNGKSISDFAREEGLTKEGIRRRLFLSVPSFIRNWIKSVVEKEGLIFANKKSLLGRFLFYAKGLVFYDDREPLKVVIRLRKSSRKGYVVLFKNKETYDEFFEQRRKLLKKKLPFDLKKFLHGTENLLMKILILKLYEAVIRRDGEKFLVVGFKRRRGRFRLFINFSEEEYSRISALNGGKVTSDFLTKLFYSLPKEERLSVSPKKRRRNHLKNPKYRIVTVYLYKGDQKVIEKESSLLSLTPSVYFKKVVLKAIRENR